MGYVQSKGHPPIYVFVGLINGYFPQNDQINHFSLFQTLYLTFLGIFLDLNIQKFSNGFLASDFIDEIPLV